MAVGVGALILDEDHRVLLVLRKLGPEADHWSIPGGKLEPNEMPENAIIREVREELGVSSNIYQYHGAFEYKVASELYNGISLLYSISMHEKPSNLAQDENYLIEWFNIENLPNKLSLVARNALRFMKKSHANKKNIVQMMPHYDIVLVQPFFPFSDDESLSIPLGLSSIHSVLKNNGISVCTFDCSLSSQYVQYINNIEAIKPKIIGFQFHSLLSFDWAVRACISVKQLIPDVIIVGGGELATQRKEQLIIEEIVDYIVLDEGELTFLELCNALLNNINPKNISGIAYKNIHTSSIVTTTQRHYIENLDKLPFPEIDDFAWKEYGQWSLFTSRGCPFKCIYCSSAAYWKFAIRYHSAKRVVDEIDRLVNQYGAKDIYIADDTFTLNKERVHEICNLIKIRKLNVKWSCLTRVDCLDIELLEKMHSAGCVLISFGVETISEHVLNGVEKNISLKKIESALESCKLLGIRTRVSVILPLPGETLNEAVKTLDYLAYIQPDEIQMYGLTPQDGTALFENLDTYGVKIIENNQSKWNRNILEPICETREMSKLEILSLVEEYIDKLTSIGYVYINNIEGKKKIAADKVLATSFSPVQVIGSPS